MTNCWSLLSSCTPLLLQGMLMTICLWIAAGAISLSLGIACGMVRCRRMRIIGLSVMLDSITFVLRGIPYFVQLLIAYFVIPDLLKITVPTFVIASGSLGLCSAAYVSQIVRAGCNCIAIGQWEAAQVLGFSRLQTAWYIIIPQMLRNVLPALAGELDQLLKSTSIMSSIGVLELTRVGMNIVAREMNPIPVYLTIAALYLGISSILGAALYKIERGGLYAYRNQS